MNRILEFQNDFIVNYSFLDEINSLYDARLYMEALELLNSKIDECDIKDSLTISLFMSLAGKILWKMKRKSEAINIWERSLAFHPTNRNSKLCVSVLANIPKIDYFATFLSITTKKYYIDCQLTSNFIDQEALIYILEDYWLGYLVNIDFTVLTDIEIEKLFLRLEPI